MNATLKLGEHFIFDLSDCSHEILMDSEKSYSLFAQAVRESGLTVVDEAFTSLARMALPVFCFSQSRMQVCMPGLNMDIAPSTCLHAPLAWT